MSAVDTSAIAICIQAGLTPLVEGPPGVGKTAGFNAIGRALGRPVKTLLAALHEPSDFNGWPSVKDGVMKFFPPEWVEFCKQNADAIIFFDEITTAPPASQTALLRVVHERVVGSEELPETIGFGMACNPPEQAPGGWEISKPLCNRVIHLGWRVRYDEWSEGMLSGWPEMKVPVLPSNWRAKMPSTISLVTSFLQSRSQLLCVVPEDDTQRAFPTPRTWDYTARLLSACRSIGIDTDHEITVNLLAGAVGIGPAGEFCSYVDNLDLPNPEELLANPDKFNYAALRGDQLYATLGSVASVILENNTKDRWYAGWKVLYHAAKDKPDIACQAGRTLARNKPSLPFMVPIEARAFKDILDLAGQLDD